jgi:hypothetical protein
MQKKIIVTVHTVNAQILKDQYPGTAVTVNKSKFETVKQI